MAKRIKKGWCLIPLVELRKASWNYKTDDPLMPPAWSNTSSSGARSKTSSSGMCPTC